jgi:signal transduction histidine kinase/response regulator RpfG family c-di-GMP phosphodiesterase
MAENETKPTVLVVDDEPRILDSIKALLEEDFAVESETDGARALRFLDDGPVAVILADQRMPGLSGDEFLAKAREISDATRILLTGYADIDALIRAVNDGGIHTYVSKPWEPLQLKDTVFQAAERFRHLQQQQSALERSGAAYRRQSKLLRSILDSMAEGVFVTNNQGKNVLANPAAERMIGAPTVPQSLAEWSKEYGICYPDMVTPMEVADLPLARAGAGQIVDAAELYIKRTESFVSVNARPLYDDAGALKGAVAVVRNITARKRAERLLQRAKEEAEQANQAKSEFLSRMSHELRTPLNAILGFAQLLELEELHSKQRESVDQILKGGRHLLNLINEVLDIARIEAGRLSLSTEPILVSDAFESAVSLVEPLAAQRGITVSVGPSRESQSYVMADRQRLQQVLLNLLSNAIKYNREDGRVVIRCLLAAEGRRRIEVEDTGLGIAPDQLGLLFSPFERLGAAENGIEGTGIGLTLTKRIVEAMGGSIGVESQIERGSTFWVELPEGTDPMKKLEAQHTKEPPVSRGSEPAAATVLYIEDNPSNILLMERILANRPGIKLVSALQGRLGLELACQCGPDLILLDLHLPDLHGSEVLQRLRESPQTAQVPVAVVSADATQGQIDRLLAGGANTYLTKPFDVKRLLALLDDILAVAEEG